MSVRRWALLLGAVPAPAFATAMRRPFEVGGGEGGGASGWLLNAQSKFTHMMSSDLHAIPHDQSALWALIGVGFAYGVVHAAGPGHGKAVIASYMMANDSALRRGIVLALFAAALQGAVAIAIVGVAALALHATAARMNGIADGLASLSYLGVAAIGAWLTWKKGFALARATRGYLARRAALAGARPCSGALLILVFALTQGLFLAGVAAVAAMALGTAITTGALACLAVFAKGLAVRFAAGEDSRVTLVARACEFAAALAVLGFGLALFFASHDAG